MIFINNILSIFNLYNLRARLSVVILLLAPLILQLYFMFPQFRELSTTIIVISVGLSLSNVVMIYSRLLGVNAMKKCFPDLMPAQQFLLPSSNKLDSVTKNRYYKFFSKNLEDFVVSNSDEAMRNTVSSAVTWLISQTRSETDFPLIYEENMNFGFSYNLLGLKPFGIILTSIVLLINVYLYCSISNCNIILNVNTISIIYFLIIDVNFLFMWIFIINKKLVKNCANKYARALLAACDSHILNK